MIISQKLANINGSVTNVNVHFQNILLLSNTKQRNIRIRIRFAQYLVKITLRKLRSQVIVVYENNGHFCDFTS
jgi:hypothetical protein